MIKVRVSLRLCSMVTLWLVSLNVSAAHADFVGKQDSGLPIEINADSFEVFQQESRAVFTGHVVAVQGKMNLKSDVMTVFYRSGDQAKGGASGISRINVDGNVLLASPTDTAKGDKGVYNVDTKIITLDGHVILTQSKNILKGESLVYDLTTGKSQLKGGATPVTGVTTNGEAGPKPGRVRALFIPGDSANKPKAN